MPQDSDIARAAQYLIEIYGESAKRVAERRAVDLARNPGDSAAPIWQQIARTVAALQRPEPDKRS